MTKRPSLFAPKAVAVPASEVTEEPVSAPLKASRKPIPSREGKRVLSLYLDPLAWKQLRQLALDADTTAQALGEEAINLLFAKHGINRSA